MSASEAEGERPVAAIFRTALFNPTERFIQEQAASLIRWRPLLVGLERKGEILPALKEGMILPANVAERLAFSATGRGGRVEAKLRAARPRLIHAHFGTDGLKMLALARALRLPLITHLRGYDVTLTRAALINADASNSSTDLDVHMHHGKKREIRQLFTTLGYDVKRLRRYQIGALQLKGIPLRAGKVLSTKDVDSLFQNPRTPRASFEYSIASGRSPSVNED